MKLDLHTHTTASDGSYTPDELVNYAIDTELKFISITDHDNIDALKELDLANKKINFIVGVEISAEFPKTLHILGYNFNKNNKELNKNLNFLQEYRKHRNHKMIANMNERGFKINWKELEEEAKGDIVGRPHFASLMYKKGYVESYQEAFDKYLKKGAPLYLNKKRLDPKKAIELILQAGGIPVIAHPYQTMLYDTELEQLIVKLKKFGLMGIEVFYSQHSIKQIDQYLFYADKYELLITAGSDFHGSNKVDIDLGMTVKDKYLIPFLDKINH